MSFKGFPSVDLEYNTFRESNKISTLKTKMCALNYGFSHQYMHFSSFALLKKGLYSNSRIDHAQQTQDWNGLKFLPYLLSVCVHLCVHGYDWYNLTESCLFIFTASLSLNRDDPCCILYTSSCFFSSYLCITDSITKLLGRFFPLNLYTNTANHLVIALLLRKQDL